MNFFRQFLTAQFLRFLAVGGTAALLHWAARLGLSQFMGFSAAVALAYVVGIAVAFILNAAFVFPESDRSRSSQARDFILINLAFYPVVWLLSLLGERFLRGIGISRYTEEIAHACAIAVPMVATFLLYKFVAFRKSR